MKNKSPVSSFSLILLFSVLAIVGVALVPKLIVKLAPSQVLPQIRISFSMSGNSPKIVEMEATSKLEAMLSRVKGIEKISSTSGNGWGNIQLRMDKHTDMDAARFEVSTIIRQAWPSLPKAVSYPSISVSRSDENASRPFMSYTVNAPSTPALIQQFTENQIKSKLATLPGINRIQVSGAMPMQWKLSYDFRQLQSLGITVNEIQSAIGRYLDKEFLGTASIRGEGTDKQWIRIALVPEDLHTQTLDVSRIQVKSIDGSLITLDKLVELSYEEEEAQSYYRINGLNSIYLSIVANEDANQLQLSQEIKKLLGELQAYFPAGYELHLGYDATEYIREELDKIYFRSGLTLLILLVFVLLIYRSWKYLLLITVSLSFNIAIAVIFYYLFQLEMQLYSLAGITISLTLIIDNTIVMADQIIHRGNKKAFMAILAATVTSIASLGIIFLLEEKIKLNLKDFACVLIINLSVSLSVALFLVPALLDKLGIRKKQGKGRKRRLLQRGNSYFNRFYSAFCRILWRWKKTTVLLVILAFGLPVFLIPEKIEGEGRWASLFNKTLGSDFYKEKIKPYSDKALGGTLRLFVQKVYNGSYFADRGETTLHLTATLPNGSTVGQMNELIQKMESYISRFPEVKQFQTQIEGARRANITISFTKEHQKSSFPYLLKSNLIGKSLELGGGSWGVYGVGDGFSNDVRENAGSYRVSMYGYNYDELSAWAEVFKSRLLEHRRIKEVSINSEFSWYKDDYQEFSFDINRERLGQSHLQPIQLFSSLNHTFGQNIYAGRISGRQGNESIVLYASQAKEYDIWSLQHAPYQAGNRPYKVSVLSDISKTQAPPKIAKENQQYRLCLQYEYIGSYEQGKKVLEKQIERLEEDLPLGYTIKNEGNHLGWGWGKENNKQYLLILLVIAIIYFTTSILFNSLTQPFAVIFVIPISYIGVFLTFYWFKLNFDQGGFASFILLSGLTVNANIYVLNEYNNIRRHSKVGSLRAYIKAWNAKISPIFLTVVSTLLGFIPFMIGEHKEAFWFPLAAGTIGGLIVSLIATFCFLPLFMKAAKERTKS